MNALFFIHTIRSYQKKLKAIQQVNDLQMCSNHQAIDFLQELKNCDQNLMFVSQNQIQYFINVKRIHNQQFHMHQTDQPQSVPLISQYDIPCCGKNVSMFACTTEGCISNAFICQDFQCCCSASNHVFCNNKIKIDELFTSITNKKKNVSKQIQSLSYRMVQSFDEMIDKLSEDRNQFMQYMSMFGLTQQMIKTVKLINEDKTDEINGQLIHKVYEQLKIGQQQKIYSLQSFSNWEQIKNNEAQIESLLGSMTFLLTKKQEDKQWLSYERIKLYNTYPLDVQYIQKISLNVQNLTYIIPELNGFRNLRILNLSNNRIRKIQYLDNLSKLQNLLLQDNQIQRIANLDSLASLKLLQLGNNQINKIENLENLVALKRIGLSYNRIRKIQNLDKLNKLQTLFLGFNQIEIIEGLDKLSNLIEIYLNNNPILKTEQSSKNLTALTWPERAISISLPDQWND